MTAQFNADFYTLVWLAVYCVCAALFFGIALWIMVRGGRDVLEIIGEARKNRRAS